MKSFSGRGEGSFSLLLLLALGSVRQFGVMTDDIKWNFSAVFPSGLFVDVPTNSTPKYRVSYSAVVGVKKKKEKKEHLFHRFLFTHEPEKFEVYPETGDFLRSKIV